VPHFSRPLGEVGLVHHIEPERLNGSQVTDGKSTSTLGCPPCPEISSDIMAPEICTSSPAVVSPPTVAGFVPPPRSVSHGSGRSSTALCFRGPRIRGHARAFSSVGLRTAARHPFHRDAGVESGLLHAVCWALLFAAATNPLCGRQQNQLTYGSAVFTTSTYGRSASASKNCAICIVTR
jgi:hypothetical protein